MGSKRRKHNQRKGTPGNTGKCLVNRLEISRDYPFGAVPVRSAGRTDKCFNWFSQSRPNKDWSLPSWVNRAARCLNAYVSRNYTGCVASGRKFLSHQFIPTVGLVTILALRRLGLVQEAEVLSRGLLHRGFGPGGMFLLLMMLLDGALDPEQFLEERFFGGYRVEVSRDLECQVYFYWGAKLVTEGRVNSAMRPLLLAVGTECDALERRLAEADLEEARARAPTGKRK